MPRATDRQLIEAAVAVLANGPATANQISVEIRATHKLPNDHRHIKNLLVVAAAENVVAPAPRNKGCRSETWTLGPDPLPDWLFVAEKPEPVIPPALDPVATEARISRILGGVVILVDGFVHLNDAIKRIEARLDELAADHTRPLFSRRNGA